GDPRAGGKMTGGGRDPPGLRQHRSRDRVDVVAPRREDADVRPLANGRAHLGARFEDDGNLATAHELSSGRQPNGAGTNHGDGKRFGTHGGSVLLFWSL